MRFPLKDFGVESEQVAYANVGGEWAGKAKEELVLHVDDDGEVVGAGGYLSDGKLSEVELIPTAVKKVVVQGSAPVRL